MRARTVKQMLKSGEPAIGTWLSLASITASRFLARSGFAWLTVDMEHSSVDWETAAHMFAAIADAGCTALGRVPANRHDHIKRMLDNGAHGVVVPMVNSRQEAEDAIAAVLYPPKGTRSVGGSVQPLNFQTTFTDYLARANDEILIVLQCEHIKAVEDADRIFSAPGIDAVFVGPNDLAASMRGRDGKGPSGETMSQALRHVLEICKKHKIPAGIHCFSTQEAQTRIAEGWQLLAINSELRMMMEGVQAVVQAMNIALPGEMVGY